MNWSYLLSSDILSGVSEACQLWLLLLVQSIISISLTLFISMDSQQQEPDRLLGRSIELALAGRFCPASFLFPSLGPFLPSSQIQGLHVPYIWDCLTFTYTPCISPRTASHLCLTSYDNTLWRPDKQLFCFLLTAWEWGLAHAQSGAVLPEAENPWLMKLTDLRANCNWTHSGCFLHKTLSGQWQYISFKHKKCMSIL